MSCFVVIQGGILLLFKKCVQANIVMSTRLGDKKGKWSPDAQSKKNPEAVFASDFRPPCGSNRTPNNCWHYFKATEISVFYTFCPFPAPLQLSLCCPFLSLYGLIGPLIGVCVSDVSNGDKGWFKVHVLLCMCLLGHDSPQRPHSLCELKKLSVALCVFVCALQCPH